MRKIVCVAGDTKYFVRPMSLRGFFLHGDRVNVRITRSASSGKMSEVDVLSLVHRSHESILVQVIQKGNQKFLQVLSQYGRGDERLRHEDEAYMLWDILMVRFFQNGTYKILQKFATIEDHDLEEKILLAVHHVRQTFPEEVLGTRPIKKTIPPYWAGANIPHSKQLASFFRGFHFQDLLEIPRIQETDEFLQTYGDRVDCRNWFTFTIDGADARDLDDALSLARYANGDTLLAVHIADVAEYVQEDSPLDREALIRSTSIYTPGKVIPMLPEYLSNDLCSLHPGEAKFALTCFLRLRSDGTVLHTDIRETLIQSHHRGVYDDLYTHFQTHQDQGTSLLDLSLRYAHSLYEVLRERRRKEGKILFESTELYFDLTSAQDDAPSQIQGIRKRSRNDMHMLIEEFMVLANEEVAKWCEKMELPFLSRVHGLPSTEHMQTITRIIELKEFKKQLEPVHIRQFMDGLDSPEEYFRISRLLLPKMAKATYSDKKFRHFGLALEYYAHFTSPIRRYPDLQVHRIIKEHLHGTLSDSRQMYYRKLLTKVAKKTSENERHAEEIERAFDSLFMCRYMQQFVWDIFGGTISGLTESAIFIELENGTEGICFLERAIFRIDPISGTLFNAAWKKLYQIGQSVRVRVDEVTVSERRILLSFVEKS